MPRFQLHSMVSLQAFGMECISSLHQLSVQRILAMLLLIKLTHKPHMIHIQFMDASYRIVLDTIPQPAPASKPQKQPIKRTQTEDYYSTKTQRTNRQRFLQVCSLVRPVFWWHHLSFGMCVLRPQGMTNPPQNPHAGAFVCMLKHEVRSSDRIGMAR